MPKIAFPAFAVSVLGDVRRPTPQDLRVDFKKSRAFRMPRMRPA